MAEREQEEIKKDMATGEAVEPNLGDLGILESETARVMGTDIDEDTLTNIRAEKANLNVRDSQILVLMDQASVKLTEE